MARQLYELCGTDPQRIFSPYCWRSRMALAQKGLEFDSVPWRFTETARLDFAGSRTVPVLVDGDVVVADSWAIAAYLDATYPDRPPLMPNRFTAAWCDSVLHGALARLIVSDSPALLDGAARAYFITAREQRFGMKIDQITAGRDALVPAFQALLQPVRSVITAQHFLGGAAPDYGDYCVFGGFMWARSVSPLALLQEDDVLFAWRDRMLDLFGGMARAAPAGRAEQ